MNSHIDIYATPPEAYQAQITRLQEALRLSHAATAGAMDLVAELRAEVVELKRLKSNTPRFTGDTPRTDAAEKESIQAYIAEYGDDAVFPCDGYDFARELEREVGDWRGKSAERTAIAKALLIERDSARAEMSEAFLLLSVLSANLMDDGPTWPRVLDWLFRNEAHKPANGGEA